MCFVLLNFTIIFKYICKIFILKTMLINSITENNHYYIQISSILLKQQCFLFSFKSILFSYFCLFLLFYFFNHFLIQIFLFNFLYSFFIFSFCAFLVISFVIFKTSDLFLNKINQQKN